MDEIIKQKFSYDELLSAYENYMKQFLYEKAYSCLYHLYGVDKVRTYKFLCQFRTEITRKQNTNIELRDLLKKAYLLSARDYFDDFMIYIEWNRPLAEKYWLPRRKTLMSACNALQEMEEGLLDELFLSMPPRTGKTTLMVFFLLWVMLRDSERSNLYCSYTDSVVDVFYNGLLEILNDTTTYGWIEVFPEAKVVSTNAKDKLLNINRRKRYASFTGRSLYGTLNGACDCSGYEIADDLISGIEEAMNKDRLNSAWAKVDNNYLPRAKQNAKGRLWIGTRWSVIDPIARRLDLLENDSRFASVRYKVVDFPALNDDDESNFNYACGVGFDTEYFRQRRASFERNNDMPSWDAQYQQKPVERSGSVFEPQDLRYYNGELPTDVEPDRIIMVVDPAWGGSDFVSAPILYQYGNDVFVHDVVYDSSDKMVTIPLLAASVKKYKVAAVYVEGTKMTASYGEELNKRLRAEEIRINLQTTTKHFAGTGKEQRIFDKAPDIRENFIFRQSGCRSKQYEQFMNNVYSFTMVGKNKHDDAPDSLAMAVYYLFMSNHKLDLRQRLF